MASNRAIAMRLHTKACWCPDNAEPEFPEDHLCPLYLETLKVLDAARQPSAAMLQVVEAARAWDHVGGNRAAKEVALSTAVAALDAEEAK